METTYLDFEQPIAELEAKLSDIYALSEQNDVDVSSAAKDLEKKILDGAEIEAIGSDLE